MAKGKGGTATLGSKTVNPDDADLSDDRAPELKDKKVGKPELDGKPDGPGKPGLAGGGGSGAPKDRGHLIEIFGSKWLQDRRLGFNVSGPSGRWSTSLVQKNEGFLGGGPLVGLCKEYNGEYFMMEHRGRPMDFCDKMKTENDPAPTSTIAHIRLGGGDVIEAKYTYPPGERGAYIHEFTRLVDSITPPRE